MTTPCEPLTFAGPITYLTDAIGIDVAGDAVGPGRCQIYKWRNSNNQAVPNLLQAFALDAAYLRAGGDHAPILGTYIRLLEQDMQEVCRTDLAELVALMSVENGEALSHCIMATAPNATAATIKKAIAETEQVDVVTTRMLGRLKALLRGIGVATKIKRGDLACEPS